jgi:hypothetical protein
MCGSPVTTQIKISAAASKLAIKYQLQYQECSIVHLIVSGALLLVTVRRYSIVYEYKLKSMN